MDSRSFIKSLRFALKLEREVGRYKCGKCGHTYIPSWGMHLWAIQLFRARYMKCPKCGRWSWTVKELRR